MVWWHHRLNEHEFEQTLGDSEEQGTRVLYSPRCPKSWTWLSNFHFHTFIFMSIESVMLSNHFILDGHLLLLPSIFPSIRVFSNELALHILWPKYWSFSFNSSPSSEYSGWFPLGLTCLISLLSKGFSRVFSNMYLTHGAPGALPMLFPGPSQGAQAHSY